MRNHIQRVKEICLQIYELEEELSSLIADEESDTDDDDVDEEEPEVKVKTKSKKVPKASHKPKRVYKPKQCCGSVGPRHLRGCTGAGVPPRADVVDDLSDLKPLTGWECMECFAKKETHESQYGIPCEKCGGNLVQKY